MNITFESTAAGPSRTSRRGLGWPKAETMLLVEIFAKHLCIIESQRSDTEKGDAYQVLLSDFNKETVLQGRSARTMEQVKRKWKRLVQTHREEYIKRHAKDAPTPKQDTIYDKIEEVLEEAPAKGLRSKVSCARRFVNTSAPAVYHSSKRRPSVEEESPRPKKKTRQPTSPANTPSPAVVPTSTISNPPITSLPVAVGSLPAVSPPTTVSPPPAVSPSPAASPPSTTPQVPVYIPTTQPHNDAVLMRTCDRLMDGQAIIVDRQIASNTENTRELVAALKENAAIMQQTASQITELMATLIEQMRRDQ